MSKQISLEIFARYCGTTISKELLVSITHHSYNEKHNNSKYVFVGMYAFKGIACNWIYKNIQGTGTQLQHYLGNITANKYLHKVFDYLQLQKYIRYDVQKINIGDSKHIFVFGLLGYLTSILNENDIERILYRFFIIPNDHQLPQTVFINDPWQQLVFLCKQANQPKPKRITEHLENGYKSTISIGALKFEHTSTSFIYVQKKAIRLALKKIAADLQETLKNNPNTQHLKEVLLLKKERAAAIEREERIKKWEARQLQKRINKQLQAKKALEKERLSTEKKKNIRIDKKQRKAKTTKFRNYSEDEIAAMSVNKRRNLQDRGII